MLVLGVAGVAVRQLPYLLTGIAHLNVFLIHLGDDLVGGAAALKRAGWLAGGRSCKPALRYAR